MAGVELRASGNWKQTESVSFFEQSNVRAEGRGPRWRLSAGAPDRGALSCESLADLSVK